MSGAADISHDLQYYNRLGGPSHGLGSHSPKGCGIGSFRMVSAYRDSYSEWLKAGVATGGGREKGRHQRPSVRATRKRIYKPRLGLNDILDLSKSRHGRSLGLRQCCHPRMSGWLWLSKLIEYFRYEFRASCGERYWA